VKLKRKSLAFVFAILLCAAFTLAACGGGDDPEPGPGNDGIGSSPVLPAYSKNAPADEFALFDLLEAAGYEAEVYTGVVYGAKAANGKDYEFFGIDTASASASNEFALAADAFKQLFDAYKSLNGTNKNALKAALTEAGITNFNISSDAMSWTDGNGSYSISVKGSWILVEVITASGGSTSGGDAPLTLGQYSLPANIKIVLDRGAAASNGTTVIKAGNDYYGHALSSYGVIGSHRFLKYDAAAKNWQLFTGSGTVFGNPSSGWTKGETVTASGLTDALEHIGFFNFALSALSNVSGYGKDGTDAVLGRATTKYFNGAYTIFVDDAYGIVLKRVTYITDETWKVTDITTAASLAGVTIPTGTAGSELPSTQIFSSFGIDRSTFAAVPLKGELDARNFFEGFFMALTWEDSETGDFNLMTAYFLGAGWSETYSYDDGEYFELKAVKGGFEASVTYDSDLGRLMLYIAAD